jgi:hypothetical protein
MGAGVIVGAAHNASREGELGALWCDTAWCGEPMLLIQIM